MAERTPPTMGDNSTSYTKIEGRDPFGVTWLAQVRSAQVTPPRPSAARNATSRGCFDYALSLSGKCAPRLGTSMPRKPKIRRWLRPGRPQPSRLSQPGKSLRASLDSSAGICQCTPARHSLAQARQPAGNPLLRVRVRVKIEFDLEFRTPAPSITFSCVTARQLQTRGCCRRVCEFKLVRKENLELGAWGEGGTSKAYYAVDVIKAASIRIISKQCTLCTKGANGSGNIGITNPTTMWGAAPYCILQMEKFTTGAVIEKWN
ncbi:hypothetical protein BJV78DRAFT_1299782 [Lactifluus subvellereus]|nr:hypothetical protein BJV78DRAFT_1299782 [Lactifluus subvellereus]